MGVQNFIPILWQKKILKELDKQHMLVKNCSTEYSGEISGLGSKVKINSINTPTIGDYVPNSTTITPEQLKDELENRGFKAKIVPYPNESGLEFRNVVKSSGIGQIGKNAFLIHPNWDHGFIYVSWQQMHKLK